MSIKYKIRDQHGLNYLTCGVNGWIDLFTRAVYRNIIINSLKYCAEHKGLNVWGYVIMPSHLHLIVNTAPPFKLSAVLRDFKAYTARSIVDYLLDTSRPESRRDWLVHMFDYYACGRRDKQDYHIWQPDNHPIELFTEKVTVQKLRYIHENPVRAGFVAKPEDWLYSSASNYLHGKGVFDTKLLWADLDSDDGWFFGNTDFPLL